jgi:hypothetical protein
VCTFFQPGFSGAQAFGKEVAANSPARPSLESLRKQAKKLARDIAAGDVAAIARARAHVPTVDLPMSQRNAQLVIAREYGYAGWQDLTAEVSKRLGKGLEWAAAQARRVIHDNDVEPEAALAEYPALLSWKDDVNDGGLLGMATGAYGDAGDSFREEHFTRAECAELLIDAGAVVMPSVCDGLVQSHARGLLQLFRRKGLLPRTLKFLAALGDLDAVRTALTRTERSGGRQRSVSCAPAGFEHEASRHSCWNDPSPRPSSHTRRCTRGRPAFIKCFIETRPGARDHGRAVEGVRHGSRSMRAAPGCATWLRSFAGCSASRGCSVKPAWGFRRGSSGRRR